MPDTTQTTDFDSTINLLQQDLSSVDLALAINIIERWEHQLQGTDIFEDLMELKQAILNGNLTELENLLRDLGEDTTATADSAREDGANEVAVKIEQIGKLLSQASQNVQ
ncbi:hypothetical protein H6G89_22015 [Oscillatoria sp. FACHB-1407]|uniref:hypothetical protein n=1 Tax=Oscillatoria sp. FACHB-1407 TaxID=2692847 RepID=UPI0016858457|nr:hypothetical protein [Oscillatoria sp. FACHB-1407]MBD2463680.1 hypothetical protein [Oscillatoria sp. FACHB-1407]